MGSLPELFSTYLELNPLLPVPPDKIEQKSNSEQLPPSPPSTEEVVQIQMTTPTEASTGAASDNRDRTEIDPMNNQTSSERPSEAEGGIVKRPKQKNGKNFTIFHNRQHP